MEFDLKAACPTPQYNWRVLGVGQTTIVVVDEPEQTEAIVTSSRDAADGSRRVDFVLRGATIFPRLDDE